MHPCSPAISSASLTHKTFADTCRTPGARGGGGKRSRSRLPSRTLKSRSIHAGDSSGFSAEPWPYWELGKAVRIEDVRLNGLEGLLVNFKGRKRIVVSDLLLRRSARA